MIVNRLVAAGIISLLSSGVLADLTCTRYTPQGKKSNAGVLQFTGQGAESYIPATNALAGNPVVLDSNHPSGTSLKFESCTSSTLGFAPYNTGDSNDCDDSGCERDYYDYIRIINPTSGHCLTTKPAANSYTQLYFSQCNPNPTTTSQIFQTYQQVELGYNYVGIHEYYPAYLSPFGYNALYNPYYASSTAWVVGSDSKTLEYNPPNIGETGDSLIATILTQR